MEADTDDLLTDADEDEDTTIDADEGCLDFPPSFSIEAKLSFGMGFVGTSASSS